jgi:feruloyl-CoA synthase
MAAGAQTYRQFNFGVTRAQIRQQPDGVTYLSAADPLAPYQNRITDHFMQVAHSDPERVLFARRESLDNGKTGQWQIITYGQGLAYAKSIGQALVNRQLNEQRPVAILSENGLEHAMMALGCLYAGVPYCPVSPAYSLVSKDFEKLKHVLNTLTPGLVFASDAARYSAAINAAVPANAEIVLVTGTLFGLSNPAPATRYSDLCQTIPNDSVEQALARVGPDTIAKFLFTSGSTKLPKGVINTQRNWCANQQQMRQSMPLLAEQPPVLIDWLPWNHTFGGNHNFGMVLSNGGSLFIDDGKPTPNLIEETLRNLREISPTAYFNVPTGFEAIANAMKTDAQLRRNLLKQCRLFFYAGAALAQPIWDSLHQSQEQEIGERIVMGTGLGMTESSPFGLFVTNPHVKSGYLGLPAPALELKLVPTDGKTEVRYRGPNITSGYWRNSEATAESFDEEGFFKTGDAVLWIDPNDYHQGLKFDGRIAEDFKLATGTFVSVGPLRSKVIAAAAPYVQDVVITGINRHEVGALLFPTAAIRSLAPELPSDASMQLVTQSNPVQVHFKKLLSDLAQHATGSASRIAYFHILVEPPSIDKGEVTDKGSINQRAVLTHREALVNAIYDKSLAFTIHL